MFLLRWAFFLEHTYFFSSYSVSGWKFIFWRKLAFLSFNISSYLQLKSVHFISHKNKHSRNILFVYQQSYGLKHLAELYVFTPLKIGDNLLEGGVQFSSKSKIIGETGTPPFAVKYYKRASESLLSRTDCGTKRAFLMTMILGAL